jgi:CheY-like chemotaxis protein
VLVVEDDPDAREVLDAMLVAYGAAVTAMESGQAALEKAEAETFDVLVTDVGLPDFDGIELLRRLRAARHAMPAVAVTAFATDDDRRRILESGFDSHVAKPVEPEQRSAARAPLDGISRARHQSRVIKMICHRASDALHPAVAVRTGKAFPAIAGKVLRGDPEAAAARILRVGTAGEERMSDARDAGRRIESVDPFGNSELGWRRFRILQIGERFRQILEMSRPRVEIWEAEAVRCRSGEHREESDRLLFKAGGSGFAACIRRCRYRSKSAVIIVP